MKTFLLLLTTIVLLIHFSSIGQTYSNRWIEYKRLENKKTRKFSDTLFLSKVADTYYLRKGSFAITAHINDKRIAFGSDTFSVAFKNNDVILSNSVTSHILTRSFLDSSALQILQHQSETKALIAITSLKPAELEGKWRVFKREKAFSSAVFSNATLISRLAIVKDNEAYEALINTYASPSKQKYTIMDIEHAPWKIDADNTNGTAEIILYKAQSKEIILRYLDIIYYLVPDIDRE